MSFWKDWALGRSGLENSRDGRAYGSFSIFGSFPFNELIRNQKIKIPMQVLGVYKPSLTPADDAWK